MAREIREYSVSNPAEAMAQIAAYLQSEGYRYMEYGGEPVFKKGTGLLAGPTFFKFMAFGNTVHMETWMKFALLPGVFIGEIELKGSAGAAVKVTWRKRLEEIERILFAAAYPGGEQPPYPNRANQFQPAAPAYAAEMPQFCPSCGAKLPGGAAFCSTCGQAIRPMH